MIKLLQNQALITSLACQHSLSYDSSPKCLIFLYFNPSSQNPIDNSGFNEKAIGFLENMALVFAQTPSNKAELR